MNTTASDSDSQNASTSDLDMDYEDCKAKTLREKLSQWANKYNISDAAVNELLQILRQHNVPVPKDSRKLKKTAKIIEAKSTCLVNNPQNNDGNVNAAIFEILKEVRCLKDQMQKSDESNENNFSNLTMEISSLRTEVRLIKSHILTEDDMSLLPSLPFTEMRALQEFDEKLLLDENLRVHLKRVIQRVGGKDIPGFVRTAIRRMLTDEVAMNLTWRGTAEKPSIQHFNFFSIIKDACFASYPEATEMHVNKIVQQHIVHASDRVMKRKSMT